MPAEPPPGPPSPPPAGSPARRAARSAARRELARALGGALLFPLHVSAFALGRSALRAALARDLEGKTPALRSPALPDLPPRPLRLFVSCGETSSEVHALALVRRLRSLVSGAGAPEPRFFGLGGAALERAGVEILADPTARATMGGQGVLASLPFFLDLLESSARRLALERPDALVAVDAPALHLPLARIARRHRVPVVHHVAPQYWAWGPWRAGPYRGAVDRPLCILPWEPAWFARHGIDAAYVGHPHMDVLAGLPPPPPEEGRADLVLLPGSRRREVQGHLVWMVEACERLRREMDGVRVVVAQERGDHRELIDELLGPRRSTVRVVVGDLHGTLGRARAALAVSGTVLTDLLHHRIPTVVIYAMGGALRGRIAPFLLTCPHFASTNLLAGEAVLPEFGFRAGTRGPLDEVGDLLLRCYNDAPWRARCREGLERAALRIGPPGAADRAARHLLEVAVAGAGGT